MDKHDARPTPTIVEGPHTYTEGHFELLSVGDHLGTYEWGGKINTLDDVELTEVAVVHWDGRHNNRQAGPPPSPWPVHTAATSTGG